MFHDPGLPACRTGRRRFSTTDGHADGLEHLARFNSEAFSCGPQRSFQTVMRELSGGQRFRARSKTRRAKRCIALLGINSALS